MATATLCYRGLCVRGWVEYDPGEGPSYACGGVPPTMDAEISSIEIDDWEEFSSWDLLADAGISEGVERMLAGYHAKAPRILPRVEAMILAAWEDGMIEALCETWGQE